MAAPHKANMNAVGVELPACWGSGGRRSCISGAGGFGEKVYQAAGVEAASTGCETSMPKHKAQNKIVRCHEPASLNDPNRNTEALFIS